MSESTIPTPTLRVELDVDRQTGPDGRTLFDEIVDRAAAQLMDRIVAGEHRTGYHDEGESYWTSAVRERVEKVRTQIIRERLEPLVTDQLERPLKPAQLARYGKDPEAPGRTTLADLVRAEIQDWLTKSEPTDRYNAKAGGTKIQQIIRAEIGLQPTKVFTAELEAGKAEVRKALREQGAVLLAQTIERAAGK